MSLAFRQKKERLPFPVVAKLTVVHSEETIVYRKGNRLILYMYGHKKSPTYA
nr:MAG TPA: hypothetical protein [Siphoviridae sp. ctqkP4]